MPGRDGADMDADAMGVCLLAVWRAKIKDDVAALRQRPVDFVIGRTTEEKSDVQFRIAASGYDSHLKSFVVWLAELDAPSGIS